MLNNPLTPIDVLSLARSIDTGDEELTITAVTPVSRVDEEEVRFLVTLDGPAGSFHVTVREDDDDVIRNAILKLKELEPVRYAILVIGPCLISLHPDRPTAFVKNDSGRYTIDNPLGVLSAEFLRKALPAIESGHPVAIRTHYASSRIFPELFTVTAKEPRLTVIDDHVIVQYEGSQS